MTARSTRAALKRRILVTGPFSDDSGAAVSTWAVSSAAPTTACSAALVAARVARQMSFIQLSGFSLGRSKPRMESPDPFAARMLLAKVSPAPPSLSFASICAVAMPSAMQWWIFISSAHRLSVSPSMIQHSHSGRSRSSRCSMMLAINPNSSASSPGYGNATR